MKTKSTALFAAMLVAAALATNVAHAVSVSYTIDNTQSFLTLGGPIATPQNGATLGPYTNLNTSYSGVLNADLSGGVLSFPAPTTFTADANPTGPFLPVGSGVANSGNGLVDNYGTGPAQGVIINAAIRDLVLAIVGGTVTNGAPPAGMGIAATQGRLAFNTVLGAGNGSAAHLPDPNTALANAALYTSGGIETLVLPIVTTHFDAGTGLSVILSGQLVATRLVPEPGSVVLAGFGLVSVAFVAYRRRRSA